MVTHPIRVDTPPHALERTGQIIARVAAAVSAAHGANPPRPSGLFDNGRRAYVLHVDGDDQAARAAVARATEAAGDDAVVRYDGPWDGTLPPRLDD